MKKYFFSILFIVIVVVGAVVAYDIKIENDHWHDPNTRFDQELGWSPIPNGEVQNHPWGKISSNSHGFRSEEIDRNQSHIIVLGDSVAWGYGVGDEETMPHYLNQGLRACDTGGQRKATNED